MATTKLARPLRLAAPLALLALLAAPVACAQMPAPAAPQNQEVTRHMGNHNSIQPETTLSLNITGEVRREPDIAWITTGVQAEADTAEAAMADARQRMNGVFDALDSAGIERRHIQTSNFSLQPRYQSVEDNPDAQPRRTRRELIGYTVSNQVSAKVTDLASLGATLDSLVNAGGNTFSGIRFGLENDTEARDEARRTAMQEAVSRAELYAEAAGYSVGRIVTVNEYEQQGGPQPMMRTMAESDGGFSAPTPISGGEVGFSVQLNITFELVR